VNRAFVRAFAANQARSGRGPVIPPQLTAQAYTALQVIGDALQRLNAQRPLKTLTVAEARKGLMDAILSGTYQTPLGDIHFTPDGEVVQKDFFVAQVRMNPDGRSGRFALLP
jgi:branched-chain amino acid transport system substrate-binding protein